MFNQKLNKKTIFSLITNLLFISLYSVSIVILAHVFISNNNINTKYFSSSVVVYAQMNSKHGSMDTLIGNVSIPYSTSNDTKTTIVNNVTNSNIITAIDKSAIAKNATSAVNFAKETPTTPISPTGISTQGLHQPIGHKLVNNNLTMFNK